MPTAWAVRGFTLIELLIVLVLIGVMSGVAVLAMGQADSGRHQQLEAERLARLLELAEQEASLRGEAMGIELYTGGYRFLQVRGDGWQVVMDDSLFQPRSLPSPLYLALTLDGKIYPLPANSSSTPQPQIVLTPDGDSGEFRIAINDSGNDSPYWVGNDGDSGLQIISGHGDTQGPTR